MANRFFKAYAILEDLSPSQRLAIAQRCYELGVADPVAPQKSSGAIRQQRYRDRHATSPPHNEDPSQESVTSDVTEASRGNGHSPTPPPVSRSKVLSPKEQEIRDNAKKILEFLNEKRIGKRRFEPVEANLKHIAARLREGSNVDDCKSLIAKKWREWGDDSKMQKFVRPKTLFGPENFAQYLGELGA